MTVKMWEFKAVDTLFFRDGTPHQAGEGGGLAIKSLFPPYIFTVQGAVRTGLALGQGWQPGGELPFPAELGDGDNLGRVSFEGPYLKYNGEYLFDVPLHILHKEFEQFRRLVPGEKTYVTDQGEVRLPVLTEPLPGAKVIQDHLVTARVLGNILAGGPLSLQKSDFVKKDMLWQQEARAGIALDHEKGTTEEGMLYFTSHIRPTNGLAVAVKVKGLEQSWHGKVPKALFLGGEARMAGVRIADPKEILPPMPELKVNSGKIRFTVTLVTPGCLLPLEENKAESIKALITEGYPSIPGSLVSACVGKLKQVGGFDIVKRKPRPMIPIIPAGSTWFYEGQSKDIEVLRTLHGAVSNPLGFNQIIIGNWGG